MNNFYLLRCIIMRRVMLARRESPQGDQSERFYFVAQLCASFLFTTLHDYASHRVCAQGEPAGRPVRKIFRFFCCIIMCKFYFILFITLHDYASHRACAQGEPAGRRVLPQGARRRPQLHDSHVVTTPPLVINILYTYKATS